MKVSSSQRRPRYTAEKQAQWISRSRASGLTQKHFAQQQGLKLCTLQRWLYRQQQQGSAGKQKTNFREVGLASLLSGHNWAAEIVLADGVCLRIHASASPVWAASLLQTVRKVC